MVSKNGGAMPPDLIMLDVSIRKVKRGGCTFGRRLRAFLRRGGVLSCRGLVEPTMLKFLNSLVSFVLLAALCLCAMPLVGFWGRSVHWSLDFASHFILPSVIAACALSILAGLLSHAWTGAGALVVAIMASLNVSPWTAPARSAAENAPQFKALLFNVWYRNAEPERVIDTVQRANADIVVLLEATPAMRARLAVLGDRYPHQLACADRDPCDIFILSRVPLEARGVQRTGDRFRSPIMSVGARLAGCPLTLHAVHLARPFPFTAADDQLRQAQDVARVVTPQRGATLVMGDFNAAPWGRTLQTIVARGGFTLLSGAGGTWPVSLPRQMRIPIDHVAAGRGLGFAKREVLPAAGSDHAPVLASIRVTDATRCEAD